MEEIQCKKLTPQSGRNGGKIMKEEVKAGEFYYKFKSCFNQFKSRHMSDYFPKIVRLLATKLLEIGLITKEKHDMVVQDHMSFFNDSYFNNKHYLVALECLVADIVHADGDVYRIIYKYQYHTYLDTGIWKDKAIMVKERDKYTCQNCGIAYSEYVFPKLDAHHVSYDRI